MRKENIIRLDSELGKRLGLTSDQFEYALVWDCRPSYLGVVRLQQLNQQALIDFFNRGKLIYSEIRICAPNSEVVELSKDYGYVMKQDVAGLPYLTDGDLKRAARQHIQELTNTVKE